MLSYFYRARARRVILFIAPAMNGKMWMHAATQQNVATLPPRGAEFIGPEDGMLACGYEGRTVAGMSLKEIAAKAMKSCSVMRRLHAIEMILKKIKRKSQKFVDEHSTRYIIHNVTKVIHMIFTTLRICEWKGGYRNTQEKAPVKKAARQERQPAKESSPGQKKQLLLRKPSKKAVAKKPAKK